MEGLEHYDAMGKELRSEKTKGIKTKEGKKQEDNTTEARKRWSRKTRRSKATTLITQQEGKRGRHDIIKALGRSRRHAEERHGEDGRVETARGRYRDGTRGGDGGEGTWESIGQTDGRRR